MTTTQENEIPIIDISSPTQETAERLLSAASTHGFLFIKNDGTTIPPKAIDDMFELSKRYFQQSPEVKSDYAIHSEKAGGMNRGWVSMQGESLDPSGQKQGDPKEAYNIAPPQGPTPSSLQPLPPLLSPSSHLITSFQSSCHALSSRILTLLATALQISDQTYFSTRHDQSKGPSGTIFRMLYYPASQQNPAEADAKEDAMSIRAGAHSDYGSLTLLFRLPGQPGLELLTKSNDGSGEEENWVPVPVNPSPGTLDTPPILVNIGDLMAFWTNGLLKSTIHRVAFPSSTASEERYTLAYFHHPLDSTLLTPVPSPIIRAYGDKGAEEMRRQRRQLGLGDGGEAEGETEVLTARQHLERRLKVTYGL